MNILQKGFLVVLSIAACSLLVFTAGLGVDTYQTWAQKPLGPGLQGAQPISPLSLPPTWTPSPVGFQADPQFSNTPIPALTSMPVDGAPIAAAPSLAAVNPMNCGAPASMNLLVVGSDQRGDNYVYGLGDVIRLVRIDSVIPRVTVLEFPRDLWVEIPDIADNLHGQNHEKLNQAYLYGNRGFGYTDDPAQGPGLMARTLELNFGVQLDHYVGVNMRTFVKLVNAVDGIDVTLPRGVDGRTAEDRSQRLVFRAGRNHLNGDEALTLARIRNDGVFSRAEHQDTVLCAVREKLTRPQVVTQIPQLIASFQDNIQTDLSPQQISQLACLGPQIRPENIMFASFPQDSFKGTRIYDPVFKKKVFIWDVDFNLIRDYVTRFQAGTWPTGGLPSTNEEPIIPCQ